MFSGHGIVRAEESSSSSGSTIAPPVPSPTDVVPNPLDTVLPEGEKEKVPPSPTLSTASMNLKMLRKTKKVWANAILLEMSKTEIEDLIFEEGMVRDNHWYITGIEGKSEDDDTHFDID